MRTNVWIFGGNISSYRFEIIAPASLLTETCECLALLNDATLTSGVSWTIVSGSTYATIDNTGLLTVSSGANNSDIIIYAVYGNFSANHNMTVTFKSGSTSETTTDDKSFGKTKIDAYTAQIKALDSERMVGYVMSHSYNDPLGYYNNPNVDWVGGNIYVGWYIDKASNNPTSQLNTRITNTITNKQKALAFSEYGCGGTQHCHSEDPQTTTTKGNYERHDIEYQMWLHEGHIAALRNFPQLLFTAQWQLFDIAVANRNEGYTICLDGETTSIDDNLRRLNNKGLVERDHITKKDTFYIYKAEWSSERFVHICGKDYKKMTDRVIKCYSNDGNSLSLYINNSVSPVETVSVTDNIATFTSRNFNTGDIIRVEGSRTNDTFIKKKND